MPLSPRQHDDSTTPHTPTPPSPPNGASSTISTATTVAEIHTHLDQLQRRSSALTTQLRTLLAAHTTTLTPALARLDILRATLGTHAHATRAITHAALTPAAATAATLSAAVRRLDLEKSRVEAVLGVVDSVAELKACVHGVVGSMGAPQDWEAAAGYVARAGRVPRDVVEGRFACAVVPSIEVPDAPAVTIESAKESLCTLFVREFEKAAAEGDEARVTRFFKLFPLIGRADRGLDIYGRYVCQGVAGTARRNLKEGAAHGTARDAVPYVAILTKLFEHVAQIVDGHGALVERHYGVGSMVKVIERLQSEADVQGGIVLDTWSDERSVDRRLTDVKSYPFSFLVQSFLPAQRPSRTESPVGRGAAGRKSEDEGVNMQEVDGLLNEMAIMLGRWSLYTRFLASKCRTAPEPALLKQATSKIIQPAATNGTSESMHTPDLVVKSALNTKISDRLTNPFNIMMTFFIRRSVEKAFQLDESPTSLHLSSSKPIMGTPPFIISAVDDVMYIVNAVIQRSINTSQRDVIASVLPTLSRILGSDFITMIQRKMRDESYPKASSSGGLPPEDKIVAFIVLMNSLDVANDYITRIVTTRLAIPEASIPSPVAAATAIEQAQPPKGLLDAYPFAHDAVFVTGTLQTLHAAFTAKSSELLQDGLHVLFNQVMKARLRPVLTDTFRDIDYTLSAEDISDMAQMLHPDADDPAALFQQLVPRRFEMAWEALIRPLGRIMTRNTLDALLEQTAKYLARVLEKRLWIFGATRSTGGSSSGGPMSGGGGGGMNALGAYRMERDFSAIIGTICKGGRYALRRCFERIEQICIVANMEPDEWEELLEAEHATDQWQHGGEAAEGEEDGIRWVIDRDEKRKARAIVRV